MWPIVPLPADPKFSVPGWSLACAMSCGIVSMGNVGVTEMRFGMRAF